MRRLHARSGLSLPELESRLRSVGVLVPGGLGGLLGGEVLPRPEFVAAFVTACGCTGETREAWLRAHETLAAIWGGGVVVGGGGGGGGG
ncbi:helix-turn-helix domain-containing protein, partial [Actinomadura fulvescens]|uniref:helix-turn-helix domain-containing protein n=1 Tax=Actinomadura fulvescens TaxID=46160 RepID=UPI003978A149